MGSNLYLKEYPHAGLTVRPTEWDDVGPVARGMRYADRLEVDANGHTPVDALLAGVAHSKPCLTVLHKGTPAAIFGTVPTKEMGLDVGVVWLLGTEDMQMFSRPFLRHSRDWLDRLSEGYDFLTNRVDARNEVHIRWLKWLGFTFIAEEQVGAYRLPFYTFVRLVPHV